MSSLPPPVVLLVFASQLTVDMAPPRSVGKNKQNREGGEGEGY